MSYSLREVAAMLGISPSVIRSFATNGFLSPERGDKGELRFGFHDLILLRTAGELTAAQIPPRKVRRVLERLRTQLPAGRLITGVRVAADGDRVVVRDGTSVWNPESGQSLFDFSVSELAERTAPFALRAVEEARERETETSADEWYELGCDLEVSSPQEASDAYDRALAINPHHADAHVNLGRLLHEKGEATAAQRHYRLAIAIAPDHETASFNLGVALEDLGLWSDAAAAYIRAIELDPGNADAHYNLSGIYERRGDRANALQHLKEYRELMRSGS